MGAACGGAHTLAHFDAPDTHRTDGHTLVGPHSFLDGWPARAGADLLHVVVEIPAGTLDKWEVSKPSGRMVWELQGGKPRVVKFLGYPGNYGMVPRTLLPKSTGGDGDPLDVLVIGPPRRRGTVMAARPIGVLRLLDRGERDDKILAVDTAGPFGHIRDVGELDRERPGATAMLRTFFSSYKGPGKLVVQGVEGRQAAGEVIDAAIAAWPGARKK